MWWGEEGYSESCGMLRVDSYRQEYVKWKRTEFSMRGIDVEDILADPAAAKEGITKEDLAPFVYPTDDELDDLGLTGLYLGWYTPWETLSQTKLMVKEWGFEMAREQRERTPALYSKTDDHANPSHEWPRFLRYGYGRADDDISTEIRHGRMTREEGINLISQYDHQKPVENWNYYLNFLGLKEQDVMDVIDPLRDPKAWKQENGIWVQVDPIINHINDAGVEAARLPQAEERTLSPENAKYYWQGETKFPAKLADGPVWGL
jgi:hypothetical protein